MYNNLLQLQDLQIGDWVQEINDITGERSMPMYVSAIFEHGYVYLDFEGNEGDVWEVDIEDIAPIEISEKVLIGFGFGKEIIGTILTHLNDGNELGIEFNDERNCWNAYTNNHSYAFINCKYIHELQHRVFDITHRPLNIEWKGV